MTTKNLLIKRSQFSINGLSKNLYAMYGDCLAVYRVQTVDDNYNYSPFTKLWQSCSDPHLKIRPIAIFALYSLNYSLAARLQDNSRPKSPTKIETMRKLQQFTVSGWLIMNGGERVEMKKKRKL